MVASSGDSGNGAQYPAASPYVTGVGGTSLTLSGGNYGHETAWSGSGGGISSFESEPAYQVSAGISSTGKRGVPDVAYDADPNTGVPVYCATSCRGLGGFSGWVQIGGTSMSAPQWAALFAITNSIRVGNGKATLGPVNTRLYSLVASDYHDVTSGTNGSCGAVCTADPGYDFVTGLGSPQANLVITALASLP
jgi:subtilase family serine protease